MTLPLEQQVCNLQLSMRLKELGVKQESIFVWEYYDDECYGIKFIPYAVIPDRFNCIKWYLAFTVAELGALLPVYVEVENSLLEYYCYVTDEEYRYDENDNPTILSEPRYYYCRYLRMQPTTISIEMKDENEANARAKMFIYLLENKLITIDELNNKR
jgi:hypothetical protein